MNAPTATALLLLAATLVAPPAQPRPTDPGDVDTAVERALERALERAQSGLQSTVVLWVDHSTWENRWRVHVGAYDVETTASRQLGLDLAQGLETMRGHFESLLQSGYEPSEPLPVYVLPDIPSYNQFGSDNGAEHSSFYGSFFAVGHPARPVAAIQDPNPTLLRMFLTHGAVHQYLDRAYQRQPPLWVVEGLASYFALFWDYGYGISEIQRIVANRAPNGAEREEFVPLRQLFTSNIGEYVPNAHNRFMELGMLFSYLLNHREDTRTVIEDGEVVRAPFAEYLRKVLRGENTMLDPMQGLVMLRTDDLEADFRAFDFSAK